MKFNKVKRNPGRGVYQEEWILDVLKQSPFVHVGISTSNGPLIIPMAFGLEGESLYLHGAVSNHLLKSMDPSAKVCISSTLYDGLVLAKSVFHHSMNYRSVVLWGKPRKLEGKEKLHALEAITEHLCPGRWEQARQPNPEEMKSTTVIEVQIELASGKKREGAPVDDNADLELPVWSGNVVSKTGYSKIEFQNGGEPPENILSLLEVQ